MKVTLKHTYTFLFLLGVFFIPFNSYEGISFLGEYRRDGAILFFLASSLVFGIDSLYKGKFLLPLKSKFFQLLMLLVCWLLIVTLVNGPTVIDSYMKQTSGVGRFIRQLLSLSIALLLFIVSYVIASNMTVRNFFLFIRKGFLFSFILVTVYGVLETLFLHFNFIGLKDMLYTFNYLPFTDVYLDTKFKRISSITQEPPFLAIYLITVAGWMFSYIITSSGVKKYLPTLLVFFLTFFSGSRTALVVIIIQFLIFLVLIFTLRIRYRMILQRFFILVATLIVLLVVFNGKQLSVSIEEKIESLNFIENLQDNISNKSRFGIQYTSLILFSENPIFGVGFGQQGFHAKAKYPEWATQNNYEFKEMYLNDNVKSFPPGYNIYTRLLAESGIVGFLIFITFIGFVISQCKKLIRYREGIERIIPVVLLVSFIGFAINWLQFDSFRVYGFWICLAILIRQLQEKFSHE